MQHRKETLSFFGENRYWDWVIVLGTFVICLIGISLYSVYIYMEVTQSKGVEVSTPVVTVAEEPVFRGFGTQHEYPADSSLYVDPSIPKR